LSCGPTKVAFLWQAYLHRLLNATCCEVSERATHCSSPHGPCKPSAQVTGRARTYTMDLPKWVSTLPEAASKRDQHSPHHPHHLPRHQSSFLHYHHPDTTHTPRSKLSTPSYDATLCIRISNKPGAPHTTWIVFVTTRRPTTGYDWSHPVVRGRPSLFSVPGRSLAPDGPTACLTPTHRTRQRIS
jgi:hypothetical protein